MRSKAVWLLVSCLMVVVLLLSSCGPAAEVEEKDTGKRVLFPISLVDFETIEKWECFDADIGKDSAKEVREYFILDFTNWKDHDAYQKVFNKLLRDIQTEE